MKGDGRHVIALTTGDEDDSGEIDVDDNNGRGTRNDNRCNHPRADSGAS